MEEFDRGDCRHCSGAEVAEVSVIVIGTIVSI